MNDWEQRKQERWARRQERWQGQGGFSGHRHRSGMLGGLLLIGGGLLFLLRNLGIVYFDNIGQYWPVIPIVVGVSRLISSRSPREVMSGVILGGVGTLFLLRNLGIIYGNLWGVFWPGILIAVGLSMLVKNMYGPERWGSPGGTINVDSTDANVLNADVLFGGIQRKIVSQAFEGGKVSVIFGGAEIDLRGAAMQRPEIVLYADAVFGGVNLKVPDDWQVEMRGSGAFGGYEDRTHRPMPTATGQAPKLIVKGSAVFGGVTVRN